MEHAGKRFFFSQTYYHLASTFLFFPYDHCVGPAYFGTLAGKLALHIGVCCESHFTQYYEDESYDIFPYMFF